MKTPKIFAVLVAVLLISGVSWAGNIPEFDAVGCDATNIFARSNFAQYVPVMIHNIGPNGPINFYSNFLDSTKYANFEKFEQTAGQLFPDPCFSAFYMNSAFANDSSIHTPYLSALTDAYNEAIYTWYITLQMKPESDINLNIYDCVLKHNEFCPWGGAEQTGRYRADWGQLFFIPTANPRVSAVALPGPYATPGFASEFTMDARRLPGLGTMALKDALYSSKANWSEGILMKMPETGTTNSLGQTMYNLKQGDRIKVTIQIPGNNTADIRYGQDNVILKYIGIVGTWYYGDACCDPKSVE
jgi:hypothetical protein